MFLESGYSGDTSGRGGGVGEVGGSPEETCALVSGRPQQGWGKGAPPSPHPYITPTACLPSSHLQPRPWEKGDRLGMALGQTR